jgi:Flp pilus assembly protein TadG
MASSVQRREIPEQALRAAGGERGVAVLEFALIALPMLIMMFGVVVIGIDLGRAVQVAQLARDADALFMRGAPMYSVSAQNFLIQLGQNMNLQASGGDGLITLSKIQFIPDPACGLPSDSTYPNCTIGANRLVQRITIGNTTITGSSTHFTTTPSSIISPRVYSSSPSRFPLWRRHIFKPRRSAWDRSRLARESMRRHSFRTVLRKATPWL